MNDDKGDPTLEQYSNLLRALAEKREREDAVGGRDLGGKVLREGEIVWQLAHEPKDPPETHIAELRRLVQGGLGVEYIKALWMAAGGEENLYKKFMAGALIQALELTPLDKKRRL